MTILRNVFHKCFVRKFHVLTHYNLHFCSLYVRVWKVKVTPLKCHNGHREGSSHIALFIINLSNRSVWVVNVILWPLYSWERALVLIVEEAELVLGPVGMITDKRS